MHTVFWFRRDLRIEDNIALKQAALDCKGDEKILPVFIIESEIWNSKKLGNNRRQFLLESLLDLSDNIEDQGGSLVVVLGKSELVFTAIFNMSKGFGKLYFNEDYTGYSRKRDQRVRQVLDELDCEDGKQKIDIQSHKDNVIFAKNELVKKDGLPYTIFTPYSKAWWQKYVELEQELNLNPPRSSLVSARNSFFSREEANQLVDQARLNVFDLESEYDKLTKNPFLAVKGGSRSAKASLDSFLRGPILSYASNRDRVDLAGTSMLSAHLHFGTISIREIFSQTLKIRDQNNLAKDQLDSVDKWLTELIWREFYNMLLYNFPTIQKSSYQQKYKDMQWLGDISHFTAWQEGKTGYPFIDASMRQLNQTGWMHNRGRMAVAMFLTKDLLLNWQLGEDYFMHKLVDADIASNNGGWQWSAGTGSDAAPYFRIFNPVRQSQKVDAEGSFIRKWVPELSKLPNRLIHCPWEATPIELATANVTLGKDYPERIVIHETQRLKALEMYKV